MKDKWTYGYQRKNWFARHKFFTFLITVAIAGGAYYFLAIRNRENPNPYLVNNQPQEQPQQQSESKKPEEPAITGQAVVDGNLELTVKGIKCGEKTIGTNEYAHADATGVYCRLQMTITNKGQYTQTLPANQMKLFDSEGNEYTYDIAATLYAQPVLNSAIWYENLPAEKTTSGDIAFDIPATATPVSVLVFGGTDTKGVKFSLK
jgi:hypothetical protein